MIRRLISCFALLALMPSPPELHGQGAVRLEPITDVVWLVRRAVAGSNAAVIEGREGLVIVDSHVTPAAASDTLAAIRQITDAPIRFVVDTHWHTDHSVGALGYRSAFPDVEIIAHHTVRDDLARHGPEQMQVSAGFVERGIEQARERLQGEVDLWDRPWTDHSRAALEEYLDRQSGELTELSTLDLPLPTVTLETRLVLHREEGPIELLFLGRGHTRGDIVAFLPQEKVLVAGDLVTTPQLYFGGHSRPTEWLEVLRGLATLDFEHILPGHGEAVRGKEYLLTMTRVLEWIVTRVREGVDAGRSYAEIAATTTPERIQADWRQDDARMLTFLEPLGPMIEDATGRAYLELTGRLDD